MIKHDHHRDERSINEKPFLNKKEVCSLLGISPATVYRWNQSGLLKPIRLGHRTVRYKRSDLYAIAERFSGGGR